MCDNVEQSTNERGLVKTGNLQHSLGKSFDSSNIDIVFQSTEKQVQVKCLF